MNFNVTGPEMSTRTSGHKLMEGLGMSGIHVEFFFFKCGEVGVNQIAVGTININYF